MSLTPPKPPKPLVPSSQIHNPLNESLNAHMMHKAHISLPGVRFVQLGRGSVHQRVYFWKILSSVSVLRCHHGAWGHTHVL